MSSETAAGIIIVGAGHAATQLAQGLRRLGYSAPVTIVGEEPHLPYHRPPLSKEYLKGKRSAEQILIRPEATYTKAGIDLVLGRSVAGIDRRRRRIELDDGTVLSYQKLALTTGARPCKLPVPGAELEAVHYIRTLADIDSLRKAVRAGGHAVIIGGGYIGLETSASLTALGMKVTVIEARERILQRITCPAMSDFFARVHRDEGVRLLVGEAVAAIRGEGQVSAVELVSGRCEPADLVVVGIGIRPETGLAVAAGLSIDNGIVVDACGRTEDPHIYAAGDCASFVHPLYDRFMRLESVQNANDQAMAVARAICGKDAPCAAVPWFWSDQFDVKLQIAGLSEGHDEIIERGSSAAGRSFSLLYLRRGRLLAIDAVNRPQDFVKARKLLANGVLVDAALLADPDVPLDTAIRLGGRQAAG